MMKSLTKNRGLPSGGNSADFVLNFKRLIEVCQEGLATAEDFRGICSRRADLLQLPLIATPDLMLRFL